jgi:hypothetical protein
MDEVMNDKANASSEADELLYSICEHKAQQVAVQAVVIAKNGCRDIYNGIQSAIKNVVVELTAEARKNTAPHPHRADLRGSGVPRKRGKGKY